ncbi:hypothetical protein FQR65_LT20964 [Abscondita terminalis]|nr:hypothetical protein FQR65_LT20964 [Abscondita terminalis]
MLYNAPAAPGSAHTVELASTPDAYDLAVTRVDITPTHLRLAVADPGRPVVGRGRVESSATREQTQNRHGDKTFHWCSSRPDKGNPLPALGGPLYCPDHRGPMRFVDHCAVRPLPIGLVTTPCGLARLGRGELWGVLRSQPTTAANERDVLPRRAAPCPRTNSRNAPPPWEIEKYCWATPYLRWPPVVSAAASDGERALCPTWPEPEPGWFGGFQRNSRNAPRSAPICPNHVGRPLPSAMGLTVASASSANALATTTSTGQRHVTLAAMARAVCPAGPARYNDLTHRMASGARKIGDAPRRSTDTQNPAQTVKHVSIVDLCEPRQRAAVQVIADRRVAQIRAFAIATFFLARLATATDQIIVATQYTKPVRLMWQTPTGHRCTTRPQPIQAHTWIWPSTLQRISTFARDACHITQRTCDLAVADPVVPVVGAGELRVRNPRANQNPMR